MTWAACKETWSEVDLRPERPDHLTEKDRSSARCPSAARKESRNSVRAKEKERKQCLQRLKK